MDRRCTCGLAFLLYFSYSFSDNRDVFPVFSAVLCTEVFSPWTKQGRFNSFAWSNNADRAEHPHIAIGHRLSTTKVYENNVPPLDWHGLNDFKDFKDVLDVSFFYSNS